MPCVAEVTPYTSSVDFIGRERSTPCACTNCNERVETVRTFLEFSHRVSEGHHSSESHRSTQSAQEKPTSFNSASTPAPNSPPGGGGWGGGGQGGGGNIPKSSPPTLANVGIPLEMPNDTKPRNGTWSAIFQSHGPVWGVDNPKLYNDSRLHEIQTPILHHMNNTNINHIIIGITDVGLVKDGRQPLKDENGRKQYKPEIVTAIHYVDETTRRVVTTDLNNNILFAYKLEDTLFVDLMETGNVGNQGGPKRGGVSRHNIDLLRNKTW